MPSPPLTDASSEAPPPYQPPSPPSCTATAPPSSLRPILNGIAIKQDTKDIKGAYLVIPSFTHPEAHSTRPDVTFEARLGEVELDLWICDREGEGGERGAGGESSGKVWIKVKAEFGGVRIRLHEVPPSVNLQLDLSSHSSLLLSLPLKLDTPARHVDFHLTSRSGRLLLSPFLERNLTQISFNRSPAVDLPQFHYVLGGVGPNAAEKKEQADEAWLVTCVSTVGDVRIETEWERNVNGAGGAGWTGWAGEVLLGTGEVVLGVVGAVAGGVAQLLLWTMAGYGA